MVAPVPPAVKPMTDIPMAQRPRSRKPRRQLASLRTIAALVLREMATSYGRSPGGYLWAVLEPIAGIAVLSLVFSAAFSNPALGVNFPLFYATGMLPFMMFSDISGKIAQSLNYSRPLLNYPSVTFLDAIIARFLLNMVTQLMVGYIVFAGLLTLFKTQVIIDFGTITEAYMLAALLGLGVGVMNCFLMGMTPLWQPAWSVIMRPMFIISCVFLLFDHLPTKFQTFLWYNPLVHVIGLMRRGFYATYDATYVSVGYVVIFSLTLLSFGLLFLLRHYRFILNK